MEKQLVILSTCDNHLAGRRYSISIHVYSLNGDPWLPGYTGTEYDEYEAIT